MRIFMEPISTSKWLSPTFFLTTAARPIDFSFTVSPSETCFTRLGFVFRSDAHFHGADFDIEMVVANFLFDDSGAPHRLQFYGVALGNMFYQARLRVPI